MDPTGALAPADAFAALEHLPVALGVVDGDGHIRYVNPAAERLYGWKSDEVVGKSALALSVAPSDTAAAAELLARIQMGQPWTGRFPVARSDGTIFNGWFGVAPLPGDGGAPGGLLSISFDLADVVLDESAADRSAEVRAEEANILVESLLHSVPVGLAFFDRALRYVRVNTALAEMNGIPPEAHVGQPLGRVLDVIPPDVVDDIEAVFATGRPSLEREVVGETPKAPGDIRHWLVNYFPVVRGDDVLWVGATVVDVTDWRRAEAERATLLDAERAARAAADKVSEQMRFLAEASRVLASSLDYEVTLSEVARLAVPEIADGCIVHLLEGSTLRLVVVEHEDSAKRDILVRLTALPPARRGPVLLGRVAATGESLVFPAVPPELWQQLAEDDRQLDDLLSLDISSAAVVALRAQDRVLGVLTLVAGSGRRPFAEDDLPFVEDLAGRAAVAIENSRAHQARTEVAQTLQRSLLPPSLPHIEGVDLAQRYHPLADDVGGDFYDIFPAGDGRWGVVIGDVCGKGVAAASLTALSRYTVRAGAVENDPAQVLRLLNRAVLESEVGERFCTIAHAMVEPYDGTLRVRLACGGHPLPVLVTADGGIRPVGIPGTAIGLFDEIDVDEVDLVLQPGESLVLYTDGFIEARSPDGAFDPGLLNRALAAAAPGGTAEDMAAAVERAVASFDQGQQRDDMALLILKVPGSSV